MIKPDRKVYMVVDMLNEQQIEASKKNQASWLATGYEVHIQKVPLEEEFKNFDFKLFFEEDVPIDVQRMWYAHWAIWRKFRALNENIIVTSAYGKIIRDIPELLLDTPTLELIGGELVTDDNEETTFSIVPRHGYTISPRGATSIMKVVDQFVFSVPVDTVLKDFYEHYVITDQQELNNMEIYVLKANPLPKTT